MVKIYKPDIGIIIFEQRVQYYTRSGLFSRFVGYTILILTGFPKKALPNTAPNGYNKDAMNMIADFVKMERKRAGLTQEEFAERSGLGLRFVRDLEQGKKTVRMDKVNQALAIFGMEAVPGKTDNDIE